MTSTILTSEIAKLIKREGGYTNDPKDRGGETNMGITLVVARQFGYKGDMEDLTYDQAVNIYYQRYFLAPKYQAVSVLSWPVALELFDTGVNMGPATATMFLQRSLNVLNNEGKMFPDLPVDGGIGPITLDALKTFLTVRGAEGERVLLRALNCLQGARYIEITEKDKTQERFTYGWLLNRVT